MRAFLVRMRCPSQVWLACAFDSCRQWVTDNPRHYRRKKDFKTFPTHHTAVNEPCHPISTESYCKIDYSANWVKASLILCRWHQCVMCVHDIYLKDCLVYILDFGIHKKIHWSTCQNNYNNTEHYTKFGIVMSVLPFTGSRSRCKASNSFEGWWI